MLCAIFDKPRKTCPVSDSIQKIYPEFATALNRLKTESQSEFSKKQGSNRYILYKQSSYYGTSYEVRLMKKIWANLHQAGIRFLTIHDAVIVPKSRLQKTVEIMNEEAVKFFGYNPSITTEIIGSAN